MLLGSIHSWLLAVLIGTINDGEVDRGHDVSEKLISTTEAYLPESEYTVAIDRGCHGKRTSEACGHKHEEITADLTPRRLSMHARFRIYEATVVGITYNR